MNPRHDHDNDIETSFADGRLAYQHGEDRDLIPRRIQSAGSSAVQSWLEGYDYEEAIAEAESEYWTEDLI